MKEQNTLTCRDCGNTQTYSNKYSYRRAMGISNLSTIKESNKGLCGKCRRKSENRKDYDIPLESSQKISLVTMNRHYNTNCSSHEELYQHPNYINHRIDDYKLYAKAVDKRSRTNLKNHRPDLHQLLESNKWDGTDMNQYTIDHIQEKRYCFDNGISREQCSDISNLQVMTMQDNINKHQSQ